MTFIQKSKKRKNPIFKIILFLLIIVFVILNYFKWQPLNSLFFSISQPIFQAKEVISKPFRGIFSYFYSKKILDEENKNLKSEISNLKIELLSDQSLRSEYQSLLKMTKDNDVTELNIAKVVLKPPYSSFDTLTLYGNFDANSIGQKVYYKNIILGEISEQENKHAIVKLYSASEYKSYGKISNGNVFDIKGKGYGRYEMILTKDIEVKEGDVISMPDDNIVLYGVVNKIYQTEDDLFNVVLFNIPVDFADINYVVIGQPFDMLE